MSNSNTGIINKILCHHKKGQAGHCLKVKIFQKEYLICSRCLGLYPFTVLGLILSLKYNVIFSYNLENYLIQLLFLPAFLDWAFTSLGVIKSSNLMRFLTGFLASLALSRWCFLLIKKYNMGIVINNTIIYGIAAVIILALIYRKKGVI